ncbi:peptidoglycan-binding protein [Aurantimonas sp. 22II-16-19i]|uniref:NlpC/P60 family protein n=1 Tax=Aurantimonas sp. 22II-16-19i TaxID=1317114 RepID=UPI0009F7F9A5|nr:peptidoglycan-binding protein [Aurantimonas sp. 22II-16-19i]ORE91016.1 peptidoglycan-binding domain 1 protein [Aurantimonas sp. 22II-16-19i]
MPLTKTDNSAMTSAEIREVQTMLAKHGIDPGPIDGLMGPRTEAAIIAFKRSRNLQPRAFVGPITWKMLEAEPEGAAQGDRSELPWVAWGRRLLGLHEIYDNAALKAALKEDGHALGDPAKLPWCGDFIETAIKVTLPGEPFPGALGKNPYWALNWRGFGVETEPTYGCECSISRNGGGHVFFIVGEDATRYYGLGGNQSNRVSVAPIDKSRVPKGACRWPSTFPQRPIWMPRLTSATASETRFG